MFIDSIIGMIFSQMMKTRKYFIHLLLNHWSSQDMMEDIDCTSVFKGKGQVQPMKILNHNSNLYRSLPEWVTVANLISTH